ncbi:LLM class flavin-dependent oxidoreductase [Thermoactinospora rubra]|uniref:LLM class flavin-dependent oxidoreductase n=1 Tax=Thermoactinospora rubra TaxID=1088767 RepID=UPI000A10E7B8|nr:LLM class flavin-dependent oxidoreductase [Thermoactinospora rubra]
MSDYGHDLLFGVFLTPAAAQADRTLALARLADSAGLDLVTVQDHPYQPAFLDAWTLLSVIAARTERVRVAPNVANLPLRPPAVLAKSVASLDVLSGGRAELALGAGAFADAVATLGGPRRTPGESLEALEEAIQVIRALWSPGTAAFEGRHYRLQDARPGPFPAHEVGIWLGAIKPRMLRLTGRAADGWLPSAPYVPPERLAESNKIIDEAAREAGRDPAAVRRLYNIGGGFPRGSAADWAEQLAELTLTEGMSAYILASDDPDTIQAFAAEVAPAVRELVAAERAGTGAEEARAVPEPASAPHAGETAPDAGQISGLRAEPSHEQAPAPHSELPRVQAPASRAARGPVSGLGVTPTPAPAVRHSDERLWDESARPKGPAPDPGRTYSPRERASGRHLVDVHDHLRTELDQVRDLVEQVIAGSMDPGAARSHINAMTMRQNNWTLGAYCSAYCRVVTVHHTLEDESLFPQLRRADPRLAPVIDRLEEEHQVIHGVLERVDRALVAAVSSPGGLAELRGAVDVLTDALLSHLSYEEAELVEPLARLGVM